MTRLWYNQKQVTQSNMRLSNVPESEKNKHQEEKTMYKKITASFLNHDIYNINDLTYV